MASTGIDLRPTSDETTDAMNRTALIAPTSFRPRRRSRRPFASGLGLLLLAAPLTACIGSDDGDEPAAGAVDQAPPSESGLLRCDELPDQTDSLDFGGVQSSEVPSGLATGQALAYAVQWPYFVTAWPRATQQSWIIVGVSGGMDELQAELDLNWPGARVLAMNIEWSELELATLAEQVRTALSAADREADVDWAIATGRVTVTPDDAVDDEFWVALAPFAGSPMCVGSSSDAG